MLTRLLPFLEWFKHYDAAALRADVLSGLTVALVLIPQSMAYAQLAGLPAYYGLYASFLPPLVAALFGSSRQLATGPVAVVSLMTAASLGPLAATGSEGYIAYAVLLAAMVGAFQFLLGVLRLGLVVNFLSHPVVNGFTNAAALIIATSQLSKLFGVRVDTAEHHYETIWRVLQAAWHYTHWPSLLMGVLAFAVMYGLKRVSPRLPGVLAAVALTTLLSWAMGFHHEARVDMDALRSPRARETLQQYNNVARRLPALARDRSEANEHLDRARAARDEYDMLEARFELNVVTLELRKQELASGDLRRELRRMLFRAVRTRDGGLEFYLLEDFLEGAQHVDGTWRLQVGGGPVDPTAVPMRAGGAVVGEIPAGLPTLAPPVWDPEAFWKLLPYAVIISLLGFMEAISIAKAMAGRTGQRLDPNQELVGQGLGNMVGSLAQSYPTSGSFSRSAVNLQAGAVSGLSSVFTSLAVVVALLFFTPLLFHLPQAVLAAVIMMAVIGLLNVQGFVHAWTAQWYDGVISVITFLATLAFAPHLDKGIFVGVALSLGMFLYKSMRPNVASLALHDDKALHDASAHMLRECRYIALVRFDGPLFFANSSFLEDKVRETRARKPELRQLVIVADGINDIDASGEETLSLLVDKVRSGGIGVAFSGLKGPVLEVLNKTYLLEKIGQENIFPTADQALKALHAGTHRDGEEAHCPLTQVVHAPEA
jgi:MFS superfamily sulfate permease-like transporter